KQEKSKGVITHSSGNHAQAVALAARELDIKATIVMPKNSPEVKKLATKYYGAEVIFCGNTLSDRENKTKELIDKFGYIMIHPYNYIPTIAGAGTAAYEFIKETRTLDYLLTPVGGGGLLSGSSIAAKGLLKNLKVIGVEPKNADDAYRSFKDGNKIYPSINPNTIADGLRTSLGDITFRIIKENVDEIVTVSELEIVEAMKFLWERMKIIVEPSGAVSLAGAMNFLRINKIRNKRIGVIISGGNVDLTSFFDQIRRSLSRTP
ncbi:MAG: threonine/serine dehydratase, partial [Candidatus Heimdallarchaeaceae archaeon]